MVRVRINWQRLCFTDIENSIKAVYRVCVYLDLDPKSTRFKEVRYVDDCLLIVLLVKEMTNCDQPVWKKHYVSDLVSLSNSFCSLLAYHMSGIVTQKITEDTNVLLFEVSRDQCTTKSHSLNRKS